MKEFIRLQALHWCRPWLLQGPSPRSAAWPSTPSAEPTRNFLIGRYLQLKNLRAITIKHYRLVAAQRKVAQIGAIEGAELGYTLAVEIGYPDVYTVESNKARLRTDDKIAEVGAVARAKFGECAVCRVRHPHIGAIEGDAVGERSDWEGRDRGYRRLRAV